MNRKIKCPTCRKQTVWDDNPWRPFCSERCKMIDLGDWASEKNAIPGKQISHTLDGEEFDPSSPLYGKEN
ncbi:MAG: DNA gyrase inhibitor YacG [Gammaproteobacteria bacterium]